MARIIMHTVANTASDIPQKIVYSLVNVSLFLSFLFSFFYSLYQHDIFSFLLLLCVLYHNFPACLLHKLLIIMQKLLFVRVLCTSVHFKLYFSLTKITSYGTYLHVFSSFSGLFLLVSMPIL